MASDDDVGYGKPPKRTQFKKGESGNPRGRPKGAKSISTIVEEELNRKIEVTENGKTVRRPVRQLIVRAAVREAVKGSVKHTQWLERYDSPSGAETRGGGWPAMPEPDEDGFIHIRLNTDNPEIEERIIQMEAEREFARRYPDLNDTAIGAKGDLSGSTRG
jgi:hypothetical protein